MGTKLKTKFNAKDVRKAAVGSLLATFPVLSADTRVSEKSIHVPRKGRCHRMMEGDEARALQDWHRQEREI